MVGRGAFEGQTILIFHYRIGRTDGASLEIASWKEILSRQGARVLVASGPESSGADFVIPHFENQLDSVIFTVNQESFGGLKNFTEAKLIFELEKYRKILKKEFLKVVEKAEPDKIIVSNVFSLGENLPAAGALADVLFSRKIPAFLIHHDFYWERKYLSRPSCSCVQGYLDRYYPPQAPFIKHGCINSIAQAELKKRKGIRAIIFPDTINFDQKVEDENSACQKLLRKHGVKPGDLIVLQATRIVRRKNIELAVDFVRELNAPQNLARLEQKRLYNDRRFDSENNRIVLILAGYAEKRDEKYAQELLQYARDSQIHFVHLRGALKGVKSPKADLFDLYVYSDLVTYPSCWEGFGNQFLEAVLSKTPVIVFEYPVFIKDIKPKGFKVISLGKKVSYDPKTGLAKINKNVMKRAAEKSIEILTDREGYRGMVERNFKIARENFSYKNTLKLLRQILT